MLRQISYISPPSLADPGGHYSHAIAWGDLVCISGQLPIDIDRRQRADLDFAGQAELALQNMIAALYAAGSEPAGLLKVTAYIVDVTNWPIFNRVYAELLGEAKPARAVVPVPELHYGCLVEVDALAVRG